MKKKEIKNILKAEMVLLAKELISTADQTEWNSLIKRFENLYEKLAAYKYLSRSAKENWEEILLPENKKEKNAEQKPVEEKKNIQISEKETIDKKEIATTQEKEKKKSNPLQTHAEVFKKVTQTKFEPKAVKNFRPLNLGIADKIAFSTHLFQNKPEELTQFIRQINEAQEFEQALEIFRQYKEAWQWNGKEEYEQRLLQLIQAKFTQ